MKLAGVLQEPPRGYADFPGRHAGASLKRALPAGAREQGSIISPADTPGPH